MSDCNRRDFMALSARMTAGMTTIAAVARSENVHAADTSGLIVCMHGVTSSEFDFRTCMEGWAKAGIKAVEPDLVRRASMKKPTARAAPASCSTILALPPTLPPIS